jgi:hypothetical protein
MIFFFSLTVPTRVLYFGFFAALVFFCGGLSKKKMMKKNSLQIA